MVQTEALLRFWFGEASDEVVAACQQQALWWGKDPAQDALLRSRFEPMVQAEARGELAMLQQPRDLLARILLLDQLPRAIYRDTPDAFAYDVRARELAELLLRGRRDRHSHHAIGGLPVVGGADLMGRRAVRPAGGGRAARPGDRLGDGGRGTAPRGPGGTQSR